MNKMFQLCCYTMTHTPETGMQSCSCGFCHLMSQKLTVAVLLLYVMVDSLGHVS